MLFLFGDVMTAGMPELTCKQMYRILLKRPEWQEKRLFILSRAGGVCEYCGTNSDFLQVHHEKYIGDYPWETPDENLKAICDDCHDTESWTERLRKYSDHKRRLSEGGITITPELHEELISKYEV